MYLDACNNHRPDRQSDGRSLQCWMGSTNWSAVGMVQKGNSRSCEIYWEASGLNIEFLLQRRVTLYHKLQTQTQNK